MALEKDAHALRIGALDFQLWPSSESGGAEATTLSGGSVRSPFRPRCTRAIRYGKRNLDFSRPFQTVRVGDGNLMQERHQDHPTVVPARSTPSRSDR